MNFHGDLDLSFQKFHRGGARLLENFLGEGVYSTGFSMGRAKKERGSSTGGGRIKIAIAQYHITTSEYTRRPPSDAKLPIISLTFS
jgi:hypothetical protein